MKSHKFVDIKLWDEVRQQIDPKTYGASVTNNHLLKIEMDIHDIYNQFVSVGEPFSVLSIEDPK